MTLLLIISRTSPAQTTAFTYQGKLINNETPADGFYDFEFRLFDLLSGGTQQGTTLTLTSVGVASGIFTVQLDFGACDSCFNGAARFLDISVRPTGGGAYTPLAPRQQVTSTPYAIKSQKADGLSVACVNCVTSSQISSVNGSAVTGQIPVASVPAGNGNYIQNQNASAQTGNFNIGGEGTVGGTLSANIVNAATQYNIVSPALGSSIRLLGISGSGDTNTFMGRNAAAANPTGSFNSFFGNSSGQNTGDGGNNSFFGSGAGSANVSGADNAFFGRNAGNANTANDNAFFGSFAGGSNTGGGRNAFFGKEAGRSNTGVNFQGSENSFFGYQAGRDNTFGFGNAFFGSFAGLRHTTGCCNAFFGYGAGYKNTTGIENTFIGNGADFISENPTGNLNTLLGSVAAVASGVTNGTAIGARASVTQSNSLILGSINGVNAATADTNVGIGTTAPANKLEIVDSSNTGLRVQNNTAGGTVASFASNGAFQVDKNIAGFVTRGGRFYITEDGKVGINLGFNQSPDKLAVNGSVSLLFQFGGNTSICKNDGNQLSFCSSSLRYKRNIATWRTGLSLIDRLRPVTFDWKKSGDHDLGLVAEEVAKVEPLLVTHNDKGEIEGVKYDRVAVVLLNAVKEQQEQIKQQSEQIQKQHSQLQNQEHLINQQQSQLASLKRLVCRSHPKAKNCQ